MGRNIAALMLLAGLVSVFSGCEKLKVTPVDVSGQPIVGHWYFEGAQQLQQQPPQQPDIQTQQRVYLHVREDGHVLYANLICRVDVANGARNHSEMILEYPPIKRLSAKKMLLQEYPLTPQFELTIARWPTQDDDHFLVDEVLLARINADAAPDYTQWQCP